jgi:hypothetical protein
MKALVFNDDFPQTSSNLDPNDLFRTLTPGKLVSNSTYTLFGWSGHYANPTRVGVMVYGPQFCGNNSEVFCSIFDSTINACTALMGSPLVDKDTDSTEVNGILTSNGACYINGTKLVLNYLSIGNYTDWIKDNSGAESVAKFSIFLILSAMLINLL